MGCTFNTTYMAAAVEENQRQSQPAVQSGSAACYPVPFGHIPYTPALPGAMGPLWDFPIEWWYYAGWAADETGTKKFTILLETMRVTPLPNVTAAVLLYGIGTDSTDPGSFITNSVLGSGSFPPATSTMWSIGFSASDEARMTCELTSNVLGLSGASYHVAMADAAKSVAASFVLEDRFGMVMEGGSGAFHKATDGEDSYEFAMPSLTIKSGSITMNGETTKLGSGSLWLDRQTLSTLDPGWISLGKTPSSLPKSVNPKPLYVGNWLAVNMCDLTVYNFVFFWPRKEEQWKVGSELKPHAVKPKSKIGLEFPSLPGWDGQNQPPDNGVNVLGQDDFDLNILRPDHANDSPHWTGSKNTYCTAWRLRIKDKTYKMTALVPGSEVSASFFEGAASICDIDDIDGKEVGHAFVEQMGYN